MSLKQRKRSSKPSESSDEEPEGEDIDDQSGKSDENSTDDENNNEAGSNANVAGDNDDVHSDTSSVVEPLEHLPAPKTPASKKVNTTTPAPPSTRRKAIHDRIYEIAEEDRQKRTQVIKLKEKEKTERARIRGTLKTDLELKRMEYQAQEAERQRAHELRMLELQQQMRFGVPHPIAPSAQPWEAPGVHVGLPGGAPPFHFVNDNFHPDLR
jgi:hypothetical protein